jgi:hypothetical protein
MKRPILLALLACALLVVAAIAGEGPVWPR